MLAIRETWKELFGAHGHPGTQNSTALRCPFMIYEYETDSATTRQAKVPHGVQRYPPWYPCTAPIMMKNPTMSINTFKNNNDYVETKMISIQVS